MVCYAQPAMPPATVTKNCDVGEEPEYFYTVETAYSEGKRLP